MIRLLAATVLALALAVPSASAARPKDISAVATQTGGSHETGRLAFKETLQTGTKVIGHDTIICTNVTKKSMHCRGTFVFKTGKVIVTGTISFAKSVNLLKITGGTGSYKGAKGTFRLRPLSGTASTETFTFA